MITMYQRPDEATRSPDKSCRWVATCEIDGRHFEAEARLDAPNALARVLVDAGVADQQVVLITAGVRGEATYPSLHRMAGLTIAESATASVGTRKWRPPPDSFEFTGRVGKNSMESSDPMSSSPSPNMLAETLVRAPLPSILDAALDAASK